MSPVVELKNVSKTMSFYPSKARSIKSLLVNLSKGKFYSPPKKAEVLKNIDFSISPGEFVGVLGENGAGKTTLLKIIAGIYPQTSGSLNAKGSIMPLVLMGGNFKRDLSGRENIILNGTLLGFNEKIVRSKIDSIIEFSELGNAIDQPLKTYSAGMITRLGFSTAIHLDFDLILMDEIFAVGDQGFVKKCLDKLESFHKAGKSLILVTHDPEVIKKHCHRCIIMKDGHIVFNGTAQEGAGVYQNELH